MTPGAVVLPFRSLGGKVRSLYLSAFAQSGITRVITGVECRVDPTYRADFVPDHDVSVARFLQERIRAGMVCFNIGANVGVYTLRLAHWSGPSGRVIAFEPNPASRAVLNRHIRMNRVADRVKIESLAISDHVGVAPFFTASTSAMSSLGRPNPLIATRAHSIDVPLSTLDAYCEEHRLTPDVVVMDVEGHEIDALKGATNLLMRRGEITWVVELHPDVWSTRKDEFLGIIDRYGISQIVPLQDQKDVLAEHGSVWLSWNRVPGEAAGN